MYVGCVTGDECGGHVWLQKCCHTVEFVSYGCDLAILHRQHAVLCRIVICVHHKIANHHPNECGTSNLFLCWLIVKT